VTPHLALAASLAAAGTVAGSAMVAFTFVDDRIAESSGLASAGTPGMVFTHNDSGDGARFFAVDDTGRTVTTYTLPGVQARDWEDMARGPDEQGRSSLWFGDIGDNNALRDHGTLVHRVREPVPDGRKAVTTEPPTSFRLRYPDGPGDAETLLVHPGSGRVYVVSKPFAGPVKVYAAPSPLDADAANLLALVAEVRIRPTGTAGGPRIGGLAQRLVTAGDIAPDGRHVALRTYTDLYEWPVEGDDVAAAFAGEPRVTALPATEQGEGLTYTRDGRAVLLSSEGVGTPVHRVGLSRDDASAPGSTGDPPGDGPDGAPSRLPVLLGASLAALLLASWGAVRRRRYRRL
jgi:hypothetical protein